MYAMKAMRPGCWGLKPETVEEDFKPLTTEGLRCAREKREEKWSSGVSQLTRRGVFW